MKRRPWSLLAAAAVCAALAGCYVYDPHYPYHPAHGYPAGPSVYDRSWNALSAALRDEGVQVSREDRASGTIEGQRGGTPVRAQVLAQADGRVRVEFNTGDRALADRISGAYERRMGR